MQSKKASTPPISPQALQVLIALAGGDQHGWAILKDIESFGSLHRDGNACGPQLSAGTLYGLIKRLLAQELIAESQQRAPRQWDDARRRYYRLTEEGRSAAAAEVARLENVLQAARQRRLRPQAVQP